MKRACLQQNTNTYEQNHASSIRPLKINFVRMKRIVVFLGLQFFFSLLLAGQIVNPVTWSFSSRYISGNEAELVFTAKIKQGWHMYGVNISDGGPIPTSFHFNASSDYQLQGEIVPVIKPVVKMDPNFNIQVELFDGNAEFRQKVKILKGGKVIVSGYIEFMSCSDKECTPPAQEEFEFEIAGSSVAEATIPVAKQGLQSALVDTTVKTAVQPAAENPSVRPVQPSVSSGQERSLWGFFLLSLLAGLGGIITPCVYPMIPMTISFFIRNQENRRKAVLQAFIFGLSITLVYTLVGVLVAVFRGGADSANQISTHWLSNSIFFLLFVFFAASFFGMFEMILPSSLANKLDRQADRGGIAGAFFMALTTVIVSFSCTGPIVGSLLVEAASGLALKPVLGMFGFGLAFSLPFTFFAMFPSLLKNLPKSGGWLNAVKVVLGFIVLAFSLKFLSNISESYHLDFLPREVYLSVWIVLFFLLGAYLLGKIRFVHDSELTHIGFPRFLLAAASFAFAVYLIPGLMGAPLKEVGSLIPPAKSSAQAMQTTSISESKSGGNELCDVPLYSDILSLPYGLKGYFDYEQGIACARALNKPVFLDFKGHACSNCKKMEAEVWSDPAVIERLSKNFVIIALYVDDRYQMPQEKWITSSVDGKVKKTIGARNADLQIEKYRSNTQPLYAITDAEGNLLAGPLGAEFNVSNFIAFLDQGQERFRQK